MNQNLKITILVIVAVLLFVNLTILGIYYQPRWNKISDCLRETAEDICEGKDMEYVHSDGYPHNKYNFWCRGVQVAFKYEFEGEQLNKCKELK